MGGIGLAMGLTSSGLSASQAGKAAEEIEKKNALIEQQDAEDKSWFNKQYYQDITKRTEVQNILRLLDEKQKQADTRVAAQSAITGATPEQQLASREINRKSFADSIADIASNASMLRDNYLKDRQNRRYNYWNQRLGMQDQLAGIHSNQAEQWAKAATNAFTSGGKLLSGGVDDIINNRKPE